LAARLGPTASGWPFSGRYRTAAGPGRMPGSLRKLESRSKTPFCSGHGNCGIKPYKN